MTLLCSHSIFIYYVALYSQQLFYIIIIIGLVWLVYNALATGKERTYAGVRPPYSVLSFAKMSGQMFTE